MRRLTHVAGLLALILSMIVAMPISVGAVNVNSVDVSWPNANPLDVSTVGLFSVLSFGVTDLGDPPGPNRPGIGFQPMAVPVIVSAGSPFIMGTGRMVNTSAFLFSLPETAELGITINGSSFFDIFVEINSTTDGVPPGCCDDSIKFVLKDTAQIVDNTTFALLGFGDTPQDLTNALTCPENSSCDKSLWAQFTAINNGGGGPTDDGGGNPSGGDNGPPCTINCNGGGDNGGSNAVKNPSTAWLLGGGVGIAGILGGIKRRRR